MLDVMLLVSAVWLLDPACTILRQSAETTIETLHVARECSAHWLRTPTTPASVDTQAAYSMLRVLHLDCLPQQSNHRSRSSGQNTLHATVHYLRSGQTLRGVAHRKTGKAT